jgi:Protein of unknown function (DUF1203)
MRLAVRGIESDFVDLMRRGGEDENGQVALRIKAMGLANPCRHCLQLIAEGDDKLVLAYRPFTGLQPYAEVGPIFLHQRDCVRYDAERLPAWFNYLEPALIRGYGHDDWIRYETGKVVAGGELAAECEKILDDPDVAYVHIRSKFNCFQCRVDRA